MSRRGRVEAGRGPRRPWHHPRQLALTRGGGGEESRPPRVVGRFSPDDPPDQVAREAHGAGRRAPCPRRPLSRVERPQGGRSGGRSSGGNDVDERGGPAWRGTGGWSNVRRGGWTTEATSRGESCKPLGPGGEQEGATQTLGSGQSERRPRQCRSLAEPECQTVAVTARMEKPGERPG